LNLVRHLLDDISDQRLLTERLGELWLNNIDIDWKAFYKYETGKAVSLPTYCFDKSVFTTEVDSVATINDWIVNADPLRKKKDVSDWFYLPRLMSSSLLKNVPREYKFNNYLFFSDESAVSSRLKAYLTDKGHSVIEVLRGDLFEVINPETFRIDHLNQLGYIELMEKLRSIGFEPDQMIFTWGLPDPGKMPSEAGAGSEYLKESLFWLLYLCKAFKFEEIRENKKLFVITHQYYDLFNAAGTTTIQASACLGLLKVLFQENGHFFCSHLDISLEEDPGNLVPDIYDELKYNDIHPTVVLRKGMRWRETYEQVSVAKDKKNIPVKKKGTYLITGGLGKLGVCIAGYLLERYEANVILIGRTELPPEEEWDGLIADKSAGGKMVDKIAGFLDLREKPGWVCYRHANIAEYHELAHLVEEMESTFGKIDGVIHAAGHLDAKSFKAVERITGQDVRMHFEPKVDGSFNLSRIFKDRSPDFVWVASSLSTVLGGLTYGAYTAANLFMDQLVTVRKTELAEWIVIDLDALALQKTDTVDSGINSQEMVEVFERSFQLIREKRIVISISDLDKRIDKYIKKKPDKNDGKPGKDLAPLAENKQGGGQVLEKSSSAEAKLIAIWKDFFGIESIDADADFFELGGDSLKAMTLSKRLHKDLGVDIPIKRFFSNSTIRLLAREINMALSLKALEPDSNKNKKEIIL
jgi:phthiocerol/phenolphthiocerol synthesis type-I polyketide synthase E